MKTFKKYLWLWEFIGVALILGVGIVSKFVPGVLLAMVGCSFIILGLLRIIPLVRTTKDKLLKWIYAIEIVVMVIIGIILIYLVTQDKKLDNVFGYLIGGVLWARGFIYFFATTVRKEDSDKTKFFAHMIFITLGAMIVARGGFKEETLGWVVFVISLLTAFFIGYSGYNNYRNYRNETAAREITKRIKKEKATNPTSEEIITPTNNKTIVDVPKDEKENEINA